jgi:hypothetical protein
MKNIRKNLTFTHRDLEAEQLDAIPIRHSGRLSKRQQLRRRKTNTEHP